MVSPKRQFPTLHEGQLDSAAWLAALRTLAPNIDAAALEGVIGRVQEVASTDVLEFSLALAELAIDLQLDTSSVGAALCYRAVRVGELTLDECRPVLDRDGQRLLQLLIRMASVQLLKLQNSTLHTAVAADQLRNVQGMVTALIDDARVAVLKLAERVVALRLAKRARRDRQLRIAAESQRVFAPLAGRLGIWHLKWELEDMALRYLDPLAYRTIAAQLDGRRSERAAGVSEDAARLAQMLQDAGLDAEVKGRAKHIFSIWRKMQAKSLTFDQVYDVRAVRVLVPDIAQCYTALGLIHTRWKHLPPEFDDYIAVPKENGYRSIHTAVADDTGQILEVQIRTHEMHREAELGVCAHWAYKASANGAEEPYAQKLDFLRQTLEWGDSQAWSDGLVALVDNDKTKERIYVSTPDGHVIDLRPGATALDFAYRIHTEVGEQCVAAVVDGRVLPLNQPLASGARVEIRTDATAEPKLEWLDAHLGFAVSARARDKVQSWLRSRPKALIVEQARATLDRLRARFGAPRWTGDQLEQLRTAFGYADDERFLLAVGAGELPLVEVGAVLVQVLQGEALESTAEVRQFTLRVRGGDREGLLRDVAMLMSQRQLRIVFTEAQLEAEGAGARIDITFETRGYAELVSMLLLLPEVPGVTQVERIGH